MIDRAIVVAIYWGLMTPSALKRLDRELTTFVDTLTTGLGRCERRTAMGTFTGLPLDCERKSIEPIASRLVDDAAEIEAMRQRLQQCVVVSTWTRPHCLRAWQAARSRVARGDRVRRR